MVVAPARVLEQVLELVQAHGREETAANSMGPQRGLKSVITQNSFCPAELP